MFIKLGFHNRPVLFAGLVFGFLLTLGTIIYAFQVFDRVGIGMAPTRGEQLRVKGQAIFGQSGATPGIITFMPPDGTGWYHIDNAGGQRFRISGGGSPGQFEYMTISHPGMVTIHGDLQVKGELFTRGKALREQMQSVKQQISNLELLDKKGKADDADINALWANLHLIETKLNEVIHELNKR